MASFVSTPAESLRSYVAVPSPTRQRIPGELSAACYRTIPLASNPLFDRARFCGAALQPGRRLSAFGGARALKIVTDIAQRITLRP